MDRRKVPPKSRKPEKPEKPNVLAASRPKNTAFKPLTRPPTQTSRSKGSSSSAAASKTRKSFIDDEVSVSDDDDGDDGLSDLLAEDEDDNSDEDMDLRADPESEEDPDSDSASETLTTSAPSAFRSGSSLIDLDARPAPKPNSKPKRPPASKPPSNLSKPSSKPSKPASSKKRPSTTTTTSTSQQPSHPGIPTPLLSRLLHESLSAKGPHQPATRISKEAETAVAEYMRTFVREAIWRAKAIGEVGVGAEDSLGAAGGGRGFSGGASGGERWLEVEDLERVAPQLLLDF